jgi:hypothetical protein
VLTGQAGRDIRWFLKTAQTGFSHGVEIHRPKSGLHASADLSMSRNDLSLQAEHHFHSRAVHNMRGAFLPLFAWIVPELH